jgi:prephenate dehydrogenase
VRLADCRLAIIGLGLMGGSLAEALVGQCQRMIGADRDRETLAEALRLGLIDQAVGQVGEALAEADLVVLAIPVRSSLEMMGAMGEELPTPKRLLDLGSTKGRVAEAMAALPAGTDAVGGHPMCGKEESGLASRDPDLFTGSRFVLTPLERTQPETLTLVEELVEAVGGQSLKMTPEDHDRLVAVSSHLPYLASAALVRRARRLHGQDPRLTQLMASGFRDSTRLAASDATMMMDILMTNRPNLLRELQELQKDLAELEGALSRQEEDLAVELSELAAAQRSWMPDGKVRD